MRHTQRAYICTSVRSWGVIYEDAKNYAEIGKSFAPACPFPFYVSMRFLQTPRQRTASGGKNRLDVAH